MLQFSEMSIHVLALLSICNRVILADLQNGHYMKNGVRSNVLPTSDLHVLEEELSLIRCASRCREECACQTYFYKSEDKWCSLYTYPLLENTSVSHNNGVAVYEMIGCPNSDFVYFGEAGVCLKIFTSTTNLYTDASAVCQQEGEELISLDTNPKIDAVAYFLSHYFGPNAGTPVAIGLHSTSSIWRWSNGEPVSFNHTHVKTLINDYDSEVHPCYYNYCGVLRVYSTVDIRIYDRCCINIPNLLVCSMLSLL